MKKENWALGLSIVAMLLSGYAAFVCDKRVEADWMGILVGILALLVTVMLGWNIYSLIDIRNLRKEISNERTKAYIESERNVATMFMAISDYYYSILAGKQQPESEKIYKYIFNRVSSILHASRINDFETCRVIVKVLFETIHPENIEMSEKNKQYLFDLLSDVNEPRKIQRFPELLSLLSKIKTHQ